MKAFIGTSGFSYKEWKGRFYPADLPASKMLAFYGERFGAVEINNTFYRMPKSEQLVPWRAQVPPSFRFALKAPQLITHIKRLRDVDQPVAHFLEQTRALEANLGPLLFQLPPNFKKDLERLKRVLALVPASAQPAFEFRHASWFDDETYALLREHNAALCIAEDETLATPFVTTATFGYLRLRKPGYDDAEIKTLAEKVRTEKWSTAFVFFKHEDDARGPELAMRFATELGLSF